MEMTQSSVEDLRITFKAAAMGIGLSMVGLGAAYLSGEVTPTTATVSTLSAVFLMFTGAKMASSTYQLKSQGHAIFPNFNKK